MDDTTTLSDACSQTIPCPLTEDMLPTDVSPASSLGPSSTSNQPQTHSLSSLPPDVSCSPVHNADIHEEDLFTTFMHSLAADTTTDTLPLPSLPSGLPEQIVHSSIDTPPSRKEDVCLTSSSSSLFSPSMTAEDSCFADSLLPNNHHRGDQLGNDFTLTHYHNLDTTNTEGFSSVLLHQSSAAANTMLFDESSFVPVIPIPSFSTLDLEDPLHPDAVPAASRFEFHLPPLDTLTSPSRTGSDEDLYQSGSDNFDPFPFSGTDASIVNSDNADDDDETLNSQDDDDDDVKSPATRRRNSLRSRGNGSVGTPLPQSRSRGRGRGRGRVSRGAAPSARQPRVANRKRKGADMSSPTDSLADSQNAGCPPPPSPSPISQSQIKTADKSIVCFWYDFFVAGTNMAYHYPQHKAFIQSTYMSELILLYQRFWSDLVPTVPLSSRISHSPAPGLLMGGNPNGGVNLPVSPLFLPTTQCLYSAGPTRDLYFYGVVPRTFETKSQRAFAPGIVFIKSIYKTKERSATYAILPWTCTPDTPPVVLHLEAMQPRTVSERFICLILSYGCKVAKVKNENDDKNMEKDKQNDNNTINWTRRLHVLHLHRDAFSEKSPTTTSIGAPTTPPATPATLPVTPPLVASSPRLPSPSSSSFLFSLRGEMTGIVQDTTLSFSGNPLFPKPLYFTHTSNKKSMRGNGEHGGHLRPPRQTMQSVTVGASSRNYTDECFTNEQWAKFKETALSPAHIPLLPGHIIWLYRMSSVWQKLRSHEEIVARAEECKNMMVRMPPDFLELNRALAPSLHTPASAEQKKSIGIHTHPNATSKNERFQPHGECISLATFACLTMARFAHKLTDFRDEYHTSLRLSRKVNDPIVAQLHRVGKLFWETVRDGGMTYPPSTPNTPFPPIMLEREWPGVILPPIRTQPLSQSSKNHRKRDRPLSSATMTPTLASSPSDLSMMRSHIKEEQLEETMEEMEHDQDAFVEPLAKRRKLTREHLTR